MHNTDVIEASFDTLFDQSISTAERYLRSGARAIDEQFGEGHAAKNPELVAAFMHVGAADFSAAVSGKVFGAVLRDIAPALHDIAEALRET